MTQSKAPSANGKVERVALTASAARDWGTSPWSFILAGSRRRLEVGGVLVDAMTFAPRRRPSKLMPARTTASQRRSTFDTGTDGEPVEVDGQHVANRSAAVRNRGQSAAATDSPMNTQGTAVGVGAKACSYSWPSAEFARPSVSSSTSAGVTKPCALAVGADHSVASLARLATIVCRGHRLHGRQ